MYNLKKPDNNFQSNMFVIFILWGETLIRFVFILRRELIC